MSHTHLIKRKKSIMLSMHRYRNGNNRENLHHSHIENKEITVTKTVCTLMRD